jgi:uncharacterized RDD family membrane protein YckC
MTDATLTRPERPASSGSLPSLTDTQAELASVERRIGAMLLDCLFVVLFSLAAAFLTLYVTGISEPARDEPPLAFQLTLWGPPALALLAYPFLVVRRGAANGQTWGRQALGVRVVRVGGAPLGPGRAMLRSHLGWLVPTVATAGLYVVADAASMVIRADRRALHDLIAGTAVIRDPHPWGARSETDRRALEPSRASAEDPFTRAGGAIVLLGAAALSLGGLIADDMLDHQQLGDLLAGDELTQSEAIAHARRTVALVLVALLAFIGATAGFLTWLHRAYRSLPALGAAQPRHDPGWAVAGCLVPLLNLVRPLQVVTELWNSSHAAARSAPGTNTPRPPSGALLATWWIGTLAAGALFILGRSMYSSGLEEGDLELARSGNVTSIIGFGLGILASLGLIRIIWRIDSLQARCRTLLAAAATAAARESDTAAPVLDVAEPSPRGSEHAPLAGDGPDRKSKAISPTQGLRFKGGAT